MKLAAKGILWGLACAWICVAAGCDNAEEADTMSIEPESVYLSASAVGVVTFTASGGNGDYTWSVSDTNLGEIFVADESALYRSTTNAGVNVVTVADEDGNRATADVTQE